jgi:hypothetical protein
MGRPQGSTTARGMRGSLLRGLGVWSATLFFFGLTPLQAGADSITGHADLIYTRSNFVSEDPTGKQDSTESRSLIQQYSLAADKYVLPNLRLYASGIFQQSASDVVTGDEKTSSTSVLTRPFIDMTLRSSPFSAGVNYSKVTTETRAPGFPRDPLISEAYNGFFGWKPADLPSLDVMMNRMNNYDRDHTTFDTVSDRITVSSNYVPVKAVQLRYFGVITDQKDLVSGSESKTIGNEGRIDYGDRFFHDRVSLTASEDYTYSTIKNTTSSGLGTVSQQVFAVKGLALNTFDSQGQSRIPLADAQFLIDNALTTPRNDGNNIGSGLFPLDTTPRNLGLQFAVAQEVNTLDVWVYSVHDTRNPDTTQAFLSSAVAAAYTWSVYTSTDNITWSLYQSGLPAAYTPSPGAPGVGKFEITFPNTSVQYIKVIVTPLLPTAAGNEGLSFPGVYVTELQAFLSTSAALVQGQRNSKTQTTNVATKISILERPYLSYDFSYFQVQSESLFSKDRRSTMSNGLSLNHRFNTILSANAGAQRVDVKATDPNGNLVMYQYSASLMAVPLPTLQNSLSYSYSEQNSPIGRGTSQSVYMTNAADLYRGVSAYLNGGETWATDIRNQRLSSTQYSYGVTLIPRKTLTITASSSYTKTEFFFSRNDMLSIAYTPFTTLFLNASWTTIAESSRHDRLQNYNVSWSPFPGGDLIINVAYLEALQLQNNTLQKTMQESVRWNINRRMYTQTSYADSDNNSDLQRSTVRTFTAQLSVTL